MLFHIYPEITDAKMVPTRPAITGVGKIQPMGKIWPMEGICPALSMPFDPAWIWHHATVVRPATPSVCSGAELPF